MLLNACDRSVDGAAVASDAALGHTGSRLAQSCADHQHTAVDVGFDDGELRVGIARSESMWFQFHEDYGKLSQLTSTEPAVAMVRTSLRCAGDSRLFEVFGATTGAAELTATLTPPDGSLAPAVSWQIDVSVTDHGPPTQPPPTVASRLLGGGLSVFPDRLDTSGVDTEFRAPAHACRSGFVSRTDIGLFGTQRLVSPGHESGYDTWSAGLSIRCSTTGSAEYRVGYDGGAQVGTAKPGDRIAVSMSGADCPTLTITVAPTDKASPGRGGGRGCRTGPGYRTQIDVQPPVLIGAAVTTGTAPSFELPMESVRVNGLPYRDVAHAFRVQVTNGRTVVHASPTHDWYRVQLAVG